VLSTLKQGGASHQNGETYRDRAQYGIAQQTAAQGLELSQTRSVATRNSRLSQGWIQRAATRLTDFYSRFNVKSSAVAVPRREGRPLTATDQQGVKSMAK